MKSKALLILCLGVACGGVPLLRAQGGASDLPQRLPLPLPTPADGLPGETMAPLVPPPTGGVKMTFVPDALPPPPAPDDVAGWVISRPPSRENRDACAAYWTRIHSSKTRWRVVLDSKTETVRAVEESSWPSAPLIVEGTMAHPLFSVPPQGGASDESSQLTPDHVLQVADGWLVVATLKVQPTLIWFSADAKAHRIVGAMPVRGLTRTSGRIFALVTPSGRRGGAVQEVVQRGSGWAMVDWQALPEPGHAMSTLPDGRLCIATGSRLLALSSEGKLETLLPRPGWAGLNPGSMVYDAKTNRVYVGLRHFVARCAIDPGERGSVLLRPGG